MSFDGIEERKLGLIDLHPDVFRVPPRLDLLHRFVAHFLVNCGVGLSTSSNCSIGIQLSSARECFM